MVRFGVIGTNTITDRFLEAASQIEGFTLVAVYSRTEERAKAFAEKYQVTTTFTSLEEMAKSPLIDAVYIASPNSLHKDQAVLMMQHKKHVLCEKPLASHLKEVCVMTQTAQTYGVTLMEAMKTTLMPQFQVIRDNLYKIGKVRRYFSSFCQYSSRYDAYKAGVVLNAFNPTFSNGALMDIGVYTLAPLVALFGMPNQIKATGHLLASGIDGEGSMLLTYDEMEATVMYSKISNSHLPMEIQGEKGTMVIEHTNTMQKAQIIYRDGSVENLTVLQHHADMRYEIETFIHLITTYQQQSAVNSWDFSKNVMRIMDEARAQIGLVYPADTCFEKDF